MLDFGVIRMLLLVMECDDNNFVLLHFVLIFSGMIFQLLVFQKFVLFFFCVSYQDVRMWKFGGTTAPKEKGVINDAIA